MDHWSTETQEERERTTAGPPKSEGGSSSCPRLFSGMIARDAPLHKG